MKENRKKWTQPQLIILGRGTPEENVLSGCKVNKKISGVGSKKAGCYKKNLCTGKCSLNSTS